MWLITGVLAFVYDCTYLSYFVLLYCFELSIQLHRPVLILSFAFQRFLAAILFLLHI